MFTRFTRYGIAQYGIPFPQKGHGTKDTLTSGGTWDRDTLPPPAMNRLTEACENITFPQLLLRAVKRTSLQMAS